MLTLLFAMQPLPFYARLLALSSLRSMHCHPPSKRKIPKYREPYNNQGLSFVPVVADPYGRLDPDTHRFLRRLASVSHDLASGPADAPSAPSYARYHTLRLSLLLASFDATTNRLLCHWGSSPSPAPPPPPLSPPPPPPPPPPYLLHLLLLKLENKIWGSLSLPSRFKPDQKLFRTFGVDVSTSPGCDCSHTSPCVGPVGIEPTFTTCKPSGFNS